MVKISKTLIELIEDNFYPEKFGVFIEWNESKRKWQLIRELELRGLIRKNALGYYRITAKGFDLYEGVLKIANALDINIKIDVD